jgi:glycosyltransferase involved in cell wall biosynthesis
VLRIAHVTDCYLPSVGGIEVQVHDLAEQQRLAGHDAVVLTRASGPPAQDGDVPVRRLTGRRRARALRGGAVDVVHVHSSVLSPFAWGGVRDALAGRLPVVVTMHSVLPRTGWLRPAGGAPAGSGPVIWTAVSEAAARPLRQLTGRPVRVLHNGIDPARWRPLDLARPATRPLTIVSVLRMTRRKRPLPLLRMLADVRRMVPPHMELHAVLVGGGPRLPVVEAELHRRGLHRWVRLTGACSREQVAAVLHGGDLYLAPARDESFGVAALEARCAGLPVLARADGGVREFVTDGVDGYLVGDDADMAALAAELLCAPHTRQRISRHNLSTDPVMVWGHVLAQTLDLYDSARDAAASVETSVANAALSEVP